MYITRSTNESADSFQEHAPSRCNINIHKVRLSQPINTKPTGGFFHKEARFVLKNKKPNLSTVTVTEEVG